MQYSYESITNLANENAVSNAQDMLKNGWARRDNPAIFLQQGVPWALQSDAQRSWNFYIQSWDMLDVLLKAHDYTGDVDYLTHALPVANDWVAQHADGADVSPFCWYDMAVGMRAYRLAYLIDAGERAGLVDNDMRARLWDALLRHQAYLADDANIAFHNNHGYYQVAGQMAMGRRFADTSPDMAQALAQGRARLKAMLEQQFAPDGVHREHSPDYHRMVYETLKSLIDAGLVDDAQTIAFAQKIEAALAWFVMPSRHIVNFGDSDYRSMVRKPEIAAQKWSTPDMQFAVTAGQIGARPSGRVAAFTQGGYFVARAPCPTFKPKDPRYDSYLAQITGFHSRTHKHADDLSFIWSDRGRDILVDAGRYGYIGKAEQGSDLWLDGYWYNDPNRVYVESTAAHNCLQFDGRNYLRKGVKPYGAAPMRHYEDADSGLIVFEAEVKHFKSIRQARMLFFMPGQFLIVFDWFHDNAGDAHDVQQVFHTAPHITVEGQDYGYSLTLPDDTGVIQVTNLLPAQCTGVMPSLWSDKERHVQENKAIGFESRAASGAFACVFSFGQTCTANLEWSKVNASGRKGQFCWHDDKGKHTIFFDRTDNENLRISLK